MPSDNMHPPSFLRYAVKNPPPFFARSTSLVFPYSHGEEKKDRGGDLFSFLFCGKEERKNKFSSEAHLQADGGEGDFTAPSNCKQEGGGGPE